MRRGSSFPKSRKILRAEPQSPSTPEGVALNPNSEIPDAESELKQLAQSSLGASSYHGYRGLVPNVGRHNHEEFTLAGGLQHFNPERDQHPAGVQSAQREQARTEHLQSDLDKSVGGPSTRGGKKAALDSGEPNGPSDALLYG